MVNNLKFYTPVVGVFLFLIIDITMHMKRTIKIKLKEIEIGNLPLNAWFNQTILTPTKIRIMERPYFRYLNFSTILARIK